MRAPWICCPQAAEAAELAKLGGGLAGDAKRWAYKTCVGERPSTSVHTR